jgi:hypothetical protein
VSTIDPEEDPVQGEDETDLGWGEHPGHGDEDDRYTRDRPPHWDSP